MPQPLIYRLIDKAVFDYNLIEKGDRILVGASGGKDSTALIEYLANRRRRPDAGFEFTALNVQADFAPPFPENITQLFENWNVDFQTVNADVIGRLKPGKKMNCWWCSTQRRKELLDYAIANGYNKLALGHHMDDILETLIMNTLEKSEFSTIPIRFQYREYPVTVIRPLCYLTEKTIIEHGKEMNYLGWTCTCNYQENSTRKAARKKLEALTDGDPVLKEHLFWSLKNMKSEYLP